jgi:acetyltransferase-like isoleucine patch superfamily enzyme
VLGRALYALRTIRFRLWAVTTKVRLKRLGGDFTLEAAATPRFQTVPRVETNGYGASLVFRIGSDCRLGRDMVFDLRAGKTGTVEFGDRVTVQNNVRLQPWGGLIRLADDCQLRDACELQSLGELTMGWRTLIGRFVHVHCDERITFGENVGLAERTTVIDSDHGFDGSDTWFMDQPIRVAPVEIGDNTFTSANTFILRGTKLGRNSCTGAGAVVLGGEFPDGHLIVGAPAKAVKALAS